MRGLPNSILFLLPIAIILPYALAYKITKNVEVFLPILSIGFSPKSIPFFPYVMYFSVIKITDSLRMPGPSILGPIGLSPMVLTVAFRYES